MAAFNKVILLGNVVADPQLKTTTSGLPLTIIRIAVGRRFAKQGDEVTTDFFNVVCFRQNAEFASKYLSKGTSIVVCGSLQNRSWTDQNGQKRISTEIIADEITFAGSKNSNQSQQAGGTYYGADPMGQMPAQSDSTSKPAAANFEELATEDDLPF